jgi:hypothetical protein
VKHEFVQTEGEYDYAKYNNKVQKRLEVSELPSSGGGPKKIDADAA